jgi:hypothetical protein
MREKVNYRKFGSDAQSGEQYISEPEANFRRGGITVLFNLPFNIGLA